MLKLISLTCLWAEKAFLLLKKNHVIKLKQAWLTSDLCWEYTWVCPKKHCSLFSDTFLFFSLQSGALFLAKTSWECLGCKSFQRYTGKKEIFPMLFGKAVVILLILTHSWSRTEFISIPNIRHPSCPWNKQTNCKLTKSTRSLSPTSAWVKLCWSLVLGRR